MNDHVPGPAAHLRAGQRPQPGEGAERTSVATVILVLALTLALAACGADETAGERSSGGGQDASTAPEANDIYGSDGTGSDPDEEPGDTETSDDGESQEDGSMVGQADDGISVEEAKQTDVLTGDYDMLLRGPDGAAEVDGCLLFEVNAQNVGKQPDTYRFVADAGSIDTGASDPSELSLDPGGGGRVEVEVCDERVDSLTIQAFSDGLGGRLIGQLDLG